MLEGGTSGHVEVVADGLSDTPAHDRWQARDVKKRKGKERWILMTQKVMTMTMTVEMKCRG